MGDELESDRAAVEALISTAGVDIERLRLERSQESSSEDDEGETQNISIGSLTFAVRVAPDDGTVTGTLFASQVWNGARYIAEYCHGDPGMVSGKATLELGAACALPSLVSLHHGASFALVTDYPEDPILDAIRCNLQENAEILGSDAASRSEVMGHKWGEDTDELLQYCPDGFDVVFAAECLWLHKEHRNLLQSVAASLKEGGIAVVSYAHHVPGCEDADDDFFTIAEKEFGFAVVYSGQKLFPKMWNETAEQVQYLKILKKEDGIGGA